MLDIIACVNNLFINVWGRVTGVIRETFVNIMT